MWISLLVFGTCDQFETAKAKYLNLPQRCKHLLSVVDTKWQAPQLKMEMSDIEFLCSVHSKTFPFALEQFEKSLNADLQIVRYRFLYSCQT